MASKPAKRWWCAHRVLYGKCIERCDRKPKTRTIRAWAVVCASGVVVSVVHGCGLRGAHVERRDRDRFCTDGPHTVVPLVGKFTPKAGGKRG